MGAHYLYGLDMLRKQKYLSIHNQDLLLVLDVQQAESLPLD